MYFIYVKCRAGLGVQATQKNSVKQLQDMAFQNFTTRVNEYRIRPYSDVKVRAALVKTSSTGNDTFDGVKVVNICDSIVYCILCFVFCI